MFNPRTACEGFPGVLFTDTKEIFLSASYSKMKHNGNTAEASKSTTGTGNEEITQMLWTIFPNPAKESVTIDYLPIGSNVNIFDVAGRKIYSSVSDNKQTTINITNLTNGVYIVQVTYNGTVTSKKLIVNK